MLQLLARFVDRHPTTAWVVVMFGGYTLFGILWEVFVH